MDEAEKWYQEGKRAESAKDLKKAIDLYLKAAERDHPIALNILGNFYHEGTGVQQNHETAAQYFRRAGEKRK